MQRSVMPYQLLKYLTEDFVCIEKRVISIIMPFTEYRGACHELNGVASSVIEGV